jgi:hypothetical protein
MQTACPLATSSTQVCDQKRSFRRVHNAASPSTFPGMILSHIDHWLGDRLFVPPIIKLCERTGQSQYAVSSLLWFVAALDCLYHSDKLFFAVVFGVISIIMMLSASLRANWPTSSSPLFRMAFVGLLALDFIRGIALGVWTGIEFWIIVLAAEYAASIRTIPPSSGRNGVPNIRPDKTA